MRGDWGEGETNYSHPGSGFHGRDSKTFQQLLPAPRARETPAHCSVHCRLYPFFKGCGLVPKPQSGVETLRSQKEGPGSPSQPCFPLGIGLCLLPPQGPQTMPASLCRLGLQEDPGPGTPSPLMHSTCQGGFLNKVCFFFFFFGPQ